MLEASEDAELEWREGAGGTAFPLAVAEPASWEKAAVRVLKENPGTLWITSEDPFDGAAFGRYLANRLFAEGKSVSVVDAETDVSTAGPPGCLGAVSLNDPVLFFQEETPTAIQYAGSLSPGASFLQALSRLVQRVRAVKAPQHLLLLLPGAARDAVLSGGSPPEALRPGMEVSVRRAAGKEGAFQPPSLKSPLMVEALGKDVRPSEAGKAARRERLFRRYYKDRRFLLLPFHHIRAEGARFLSGKERNLQHPKVMYFEALPDEKEAWAAVKEPLSDREREEVCKAGGALKLHEVLAGREAGLQVGLADKDGDTLALGLIQRFDYADRYVEVWTPLAIGKENRVKVLQFGSLRLALSGEEREPVEAGYF